MLHLFEPEPEVLQVLLVLENALLLLTHLLTHLRGSSHPELLLHRHDLLLLTHHLLLTHQHVLPEAPAESARTPPGSDQIASADPRTDLQEPTHVRGSPTTPTTDRWGGRGGGSVGV